jgi:hypothetical protein
VALALDVEGDQVHRLADRDDRQADLARDAVCGPVPGTRLLGVDRRVRHQVHGRAHDLGGVAVEDDGAVHLRELAEAGRGELDIEHETAGAHGLDGLVVAEHDQGPGVAAEDALEAFTQLGTGGDGSQRRPQESLVLGSRAIGPLDRGHDPPPGCSRFSECKRRYLRIRSVRQPSATGSSLTFCRREGFLGCRWGWDPSSDAME